MWPASTALRRSLAASSSVRRCPTSAGSAAPPAAESAARRSDSSRSPASRALSSRQGQTRVQWYTMSKQSGQAKQGTSGQAREADAASVYG
jgi:hypothetical protein